MNGPQARIIPDPDGLNADFYRHLARGQIHFQRCAGCSAVHHPPRYRCASCGSADYRWVASTGRGRVFSWTVTHRPVDPGWANEIPYATLIVEMDEGVRVVGALRGLAPAKLALDQRVMAEIETVSEAFAFIHFRPDGSTRLG
jgi:uncharacterized OB-fold protein